MMNVRAFNNDYCTKNTIPLFTRSYEKIHNEIIANKKRIAILVEIFLSQLKTKLISAEVQMHEYDTSKCIALLPYWICMTYIYIYRKHITRKT